MHSHFGLSASSLLKENQCIQLKRTSSRRIQEKNRLCGDVENMIDFVKVAPVIVDIDGPGPRVCEAGTGGEEHCDARRSD